LTLAAIEKRPFSSTFCALPVTISVFSCTVISISSCARFVERARQPPMSDQPLVYDPGGDLPLLVVPNQKSGFGRD
jgi:hypothetical protein